MDDKTKTLEKLLLQHTATGSSITPKQMDKRQLRQQKDAPRAIATQRPAMPKSTTSINLLKKAKHQPQTKTLAALKKSPPSTEQKNLESCRAANQLKSQEAWQAKKQLLKALTVKLTTNHPTLFNHIAPKPFAIGIHREIAARYPEYSKKVIGLMLASWVKKTKYQAALVVGADRYNLAGLPVGKVTENEIPPALSERS